MDPEDKEKLNRNLTKLASKTKWSKSLEQYLVDNNVFSQKLLDVMLVRRVSQPVASPASTTLCSRQAMMPPPGPDSCSWTSRRGDLGPWSDWSRVWSSRTTSRPPKSWIQRCQSRASQRDNSCERGEAVADQG